MKKISENTLTGSIGEDTVGLVVQRQMGYIWRPTTRLDVGYDGEIELRDQNTKEASGLILKVQSKSLEEFDAENEEKFTYYCNQDDVDYWLNSNVPDVLVVSRSRSMDELYWSPIKRYFELHPEDQKNRQIKFLKENKFNASAKTDIAKLATPKDKGLYVAPLPKEETIYSNLLEIKKFPTKIYIAPALTTDPAQIISKFNSLGIRNTHWLIKNDILVSLQNFSGEEWSGICEQTSVEENDISEWIEDKDPGKRNDFIYLLNKGLDELCLSLGIKHDHYLNHYYFLPGRHNIERVEKYRSFYKNTSRRVVRAVYSKTGTIHILYYRHFAFESRFVQFDKKWYLEISPTYHITRDGSQADNFYEKKVSGMKRLQKNGNVLGEIFFIYQYLKKDLHPKHASKALIQFDDLIKFEIVGGIDDKQWLSKEDDKMFIKDEEDEIETGVTI